MKPSLFYSTLSVAFIVSVIGILAMIFLQVQPDDKLLSIISGVIGAYLGARIPKPTQDETINTRAE